ncbi:MAG: hypothetical protein HYZ57_10310 [Acidobacteria bacterium]|nr:hypothetical protein [Acidobacteriota bacterium]MBI3280221.1 hypothetical protein [Acidobacteriota bacterium]
MEAILPALGELLLQALPTFFVVLFLHFFLKAIFFKPLEKVLAQRREATEGARQQAQRSLEAAAQKTAEYGESLRAARTEIYKEQEELRRQWRAEQAARVQEARRNTDLIVKQAKEQLAAEAAEARRALEGESRAIADAVTAAILEEKAA